MIAPLGDPFAVGVDGKAVRAAAFIVSDGTDLGQRRVVNANGSIVKRGEDRFAVGREQRCS